MRAAVAGLDSYRHVLERFDESDAGDLLGRTLYTDTTTYLPGDLLVKVDPGADQPPQDIVRRIINIRPDLQVFAARLVPQRIRTEAGWVDPTELRGRRVFAVAGLGRPEGFRTLLEFAGAEIVGYRWFADHHLYGLEDRAWIVREAEKYGAVVVTTAKDAVKLDPFEGLWVVETVMQSLEGGWSHLWSLAPEIS